MRNLISVVLVLFISACAVQVNEMTPEPTVQQFDLTDSEGDGVINARDHCLTSLMGAQVDNKGCGAQRMEKVRRNLSVNFANNSSIVEPQFLPEVAALAGVMQASPETKVTIEGHTSQIGSKVSNKKLSQQRAQAIKDILVNQFAINESRITVIGYGGERPLLEGDDESMHSDNRRIVAELSSDQPFTDMKWTIYSVDQRIE